MEGGSGVTRSIIDELLSSDLQGDQTVDECGVTRSINMNFILRISKHIKYKVKVVLLELSLLNFILGISNEIKWNVNVVVLDGSLMNFILWISKEIKRKVKLVILQVSLTNSFFGSPTRSNGN